MSVFVGRFIFSVLVVSFFSGMPVAQAAEHRALADVVLTNGAKVQRAFLALLVADMLARRGDAVVPWVLRGVKDAPKNIRSFLQWIGRGSGNGLFRDLVAFLRTRKINVSCVLLCLWLAFKRPVALARWASVSSPGIGGLLYPVRDAERGQGLEVYHLATEDKLKKSQQLSVYGQRECVSAFDRAQCVESHYSLTDPVLRQCFDNLTTLEAEHVVMLLSACRREEDRHFFSPLVWDTLSQCETKIRLNDSLREAIQAYVKKCVRYGQMFVGEHNRVSAAFRDFFYPPVQQGSLLANYANNLNAQLAASDKRDADLTQAASDLLGVGLRQDNTGRIPAWLHALRDTFFSNGEHKVVEFFIQHYPMPLRISDLENTSVLGGPETVRLLERDDIDWSKISGRTSGRDTDSRPLFTFFKDNPDKIGLLSSKIFHLLRVDDLIMLRDCGLLSDQSKAYLASVFSSYKHQFGLEGAALLSFAKKLTDDEKVQFMRDPDVRNQLFSMFVPGRDLSFPVLAEFIPFIEPAERSGDRFMQERFFNIPGWQLCVDALGLRANALPPSAYAMLDRCIEHDKNSPAKLCSLAGTLPDLFLSAYIERLAALPFDRFVAFTDYLFDGKHTAVAKRFAESDSFVNRCVCDFQITRIVPFIMALPDGKIEPFLSRICVDTPSGHAVAQQFMYAGSTIDIASHICSWSDESVVHFIGGLVQIPSALSANDALWEKISRTLVNERTRDGAVRAIVNIIQKWADSSQLGGGSLACLERALEIDSVVCSAILHAPNFLAANPAAGSVIAERLLAGVPTVLSCVNNYLDVVVSGGSFRQRDYAFVINEPLRVAALTGAAASGRQEVKECCARALGLLTLLHEGMYGPLAAAPSDGHSDTSSEGPTSVAIFLAVAGDSALSPESRKRFDTILEKFKTAEFKRLRSFLSSNLAGRQVMVSEQEAEKAFLRSCIYRSPVLAGSFLDELFKAIQDALSRIVTEEVQKHNQVLAARQTQPNQLVVALAL